MSVKTLKKSVAVLCQQAILTNLLYRKDALFIRYDNIPYVKRNGIFKPSFREIELALANAMHQLNSGHTDPCVPETREAEHDDVIPPAILRKTARA